MNSALWLLIRSLMNSALFVVAIDRVNCVSFRYNLLGLPWL